jgi:subtilisin family serine protease
MEGCEGGCTSLALLPRKLNHSQKDAEKETKMRRRSVVRLVLLLMCLLLPLSAQAQQSPRPHIPPSGGGRLAERVPGDLKLIDPSLRQHSGPVNVVIELTGLPTAQTFAAPRGSGPAIQAAQAAQAQLARVNQSQQALLAPLANLGASVLYRTQRVYNGIAARVDAARLSQIAALPGIKALHPLITKQLDRNSSVPLIGAPELWSGAGTGVSLTGKGITIAIIDTGVDYLHKDFGGPGTEAAYALNDTTAITETPPLFPTPKVIGGYDFVGDDYNPNDDVTANDVARPDPDPMDCNGHGSHVAGIAAGQGVTADGETYTGPYNPDIYASTAFRIGPGVAPEAQIYALKVFGCEGGTNYADAAIEWAIDPNGDGDFSDRADVINMSLGSDFGSVNDTTSVAADNAILAGTIVVASAGNAEDTYYITGSPATSPRVISVASSVDAGLVFPGVRVLSPPSIAGDIEARRADFGPALTETGITGNVVYAEPADACTAITNAAEIAGNIALIDRGGCDFVVKVHNAQDAGAVAAIVVNNVPTDPVVMGGDDPEITIPSVMISQASGQAIKDALAAGATVQVLLSSTVTVARPDLGDTLSAFSSRGPRRNGSQLKPDISAPGQDIFSTAAGTGDQGTSISGTSQAAPHVAGSMALMRQLHPTWSIQDLKALVMNTATNNIRSAPDPTSAIFPPSRVGAGRIDLPNAAASNVIAYNDGAPGLISVSFGDVEVLDALTATRTIRVANKGAQAASYDVSYVPVTSIPGVTYSLSTPSVTVGPFGTATIVVTMNADPAQMKHNHDPTISETQQNLPRPWISEASGYVALTPAELPARNFVTFVNGQNEVPPVDSDVTATGVFTYTAGSGTVEYRLDFAEPITMTMAHFHRGPAGQSGPVAVPIAIGDGTFGPGDPLAGSVTLSAADAVLLRTGGLYVNFHTAAHPAGEVRGQVVVALTDTSLRVPVYVTARPAADMRAEQTSLDFGTASRATATIELTGTGLLTGENFPIDEVSLVTAFELQAISPNDAASSGLDQKTDLAYVGVASDYASTTTFDQTFVYFGIATHADWSTPNEVAFEVHIDTNRDGRDDFILFNSNLGLLSGLDPNDIFVTALFNLNSGELLLEDFLNGVPPSAIDTVPFNTNVVVLPVSAADLGLTRSRARFNYRVETYSIDAEGPGSGLIFPSLVDQTGKLTFNAARPGLDTTGGVAGVPAYFDLPGESITVRFDRSFFRSGRSLGVLLLHHHNRASNRAEVLTVSYQR